MTSPIACPACQQADQVGSLPSVYSQNRREWMETRHTTDHNGQWTTYEERCEEHTPLGELLRPPAKPRLPVDPKLGHRFRVGLSVALSGCTGLAALPALAALALFLPESLLPPSVLSLSPRLELAVCLLVAVALPVLALLALFVRRQRHTHRTRVADYEAALAAHHGRLMPAFTEAQAWWEQLSFCARDQLVFGPGLPQPLAPADLAAQLAHRMAR